MFGEHSFAEALPPSWRQGDLCFRGSCAEARAWTAGKPRGVARRPERASLAFPRAGSECQAGARAEPRARRARALRRVDSPHQAVGRPRSLEGGRRRGPALANCQALRSRSETFSAVWAPSDALAAVRTRARESAVGGISEPAQTSSSLPVRGQLGRRRKARATRPEASCSKCGSCKSAAARPTA